MAVTGTPATAGDDLVGDGADDLVRAPGGNDRIAAGGGSDGGAGTAVAAHEDIRADLTASAVNGVAFAKHREGEQTTWDGDGRPTNAERIEFGDRVTMPAHGNAAPLGTGLSRETHR